MIRLHEKYALLAVIDPQTINSTPKTSPWVDSGGVHELFAELLLGDMANETVDFKIEQATDNAGTGAKDLKAATQRAASLTANDLKQVQISVDAARLDIANGFRFVRIRAVTGGVTGGPGAATLRGWSRQQPATQAASVVETSTL